MSSVVETVTEIVQPLVDELQFELVEVEFVKEGKNWFLRIYIDKPGGIDLDDCALLSEKLSDTMDALAHDPIPQAYFLEVSSPGAERPLKTEKDYENAVDSYIHVSLYEQLDGEKQFNGFLTELTKDTLTLKIRIKTREKLIEIDRKKIAKARYAIQF